MKWNLDLDSKYYKDIKINIQASEITGEISRLTTFIDQISNTILVKKADQYIEIDILEVIYIENLERMNFIYTYSDIYEVSSPLYELEEKLKRFRFIRVNKQTLINPRCIKTVKALLNSRFELLMTSGEKVIVTRHYRKEFNSIFNELLSLTGLSDKRHRKYGQCSGGEKRKADIIRALVHNPNFLILDEPTIGLDANSRKEIWTILDILQKKHKLTIFLTTHYIEEADYVDHVLVLHEGKIEVQGTPEDLRARYSETILKLETKTKDCIRIITDLNYTFKLEHNSIFS